MATWLEFVSICLRDSGVVGMGQTPNGQMAADAQFRLNLMLDEWRADNLLAYQILDLSAVCNGTNSLTIGPGGAFNVAVRPDALNYAYLRQLNQPNPQTPIDYPLQVLDSPNDYAAIPLKTMTAAPADAVWLDAGYPMGTIKIYPVPPTALWELHVLVLGLLDRVTNLNDVMLLPPRYGRAIYRNLCVDLGLAFRIDPKPGMARMAGASLRAIRRKNARVPIMDMPSSLGLQNSYNIFSDRGG